MLVHPVVLGVVAELLAAVLLVATGVAAWTGRAARTLERLWGRTPTRVEAAAFVGLGTGVGVWAVGQAVDGAAAQIGQPAEIGATGLTGLGLVAVAALVLAASALARPEDADHWSSPGAASPDR